MSAGGRPSNAAVGRVTNVLLGIASDLERAADGAAPAAFAGRVRAAAFDLTRIDCEPTYSGMTARELLGEVTDAAFGEDGETHTAGELLARVRWLRARAADAALEPTGEGYRCTRCDAVLDATEYEARDGGAYLTRPYRHCPECGARFDGGGANGE